MSSTRRSASSIARSRSTRRLPPRRRRPLAARYHKQELDEAAFPTFASLANSASAAEAWAMGFNWYFNKNLRLMFDYEDTRFEGGAALGDREDEKVFFSRFQIAF